MKFSTYIKVLFGAAALLVSTSSQALILKTINGFETGSWGYYSYTHDISGPTSITGGTGTWDTDTGEVNLTGVSVGGSIMDVTGILNIVGDFIGGFLNIAGVKYTFLPQDFGSYEDNFNPNSFNTANGMISLWGSTKDGEFVGYTDYVNGESSADLQIAFVPEPGILALFGSGLLGLIVFSRRKSARAKA